MSTVVSPADRVAIRTALRNRDGAALDEIIISMALADAPSIAAVESFLTAEEARLDPETRQWWDQPCNCHGRLN